MNKKSLKVKIQNIILSVIEEDYFIIVNHIREGSFFIGGGGGGSGYLEIFFEKNRDPPTSQNGLIHDPSQIPTQKHLTLPPPPPSQK